MSYIFNITVKKDHVYCEASGNDSYTAKFEILSKVKEACDTHKIFNVLILSEMTPISTVDAYGISDIFKELKLSVKYRIAWVDKNDISQKRHTIAETVLKNRGLVNGYGFHIDELEMAKEWLFHKVPPKRN